MPENGLSLVALTAHRLDGCNALQRFAGARPNMSSRPGLHRVTPRDTPAGHRNPGHDRRR